ncbi:MAG TPA: hypothetical protein VHR66_10085 [Gemmataceae bacterium]|jgi:hypothetical protein|nr:hypothetical protein [Gemmataceae bacterium]
MTPITATLVLALSIAAPAPKSDKGIPKDLIDLLPEDSAAVAVLHVQRAAKCELGKAILKVVAGEQDADDPVHVEEFVRDAEVALLSQFLIDKGFGDFCLILRLKEKSELPKTLIAKANKLAKGRVPEQIGKRTVYPLDNSEFSFAVIDDRTIMMVLATGDRKQVAETRTAAYGEAPGPSPALRKMLVDDKDDRALRFYGSHPKKMALSAHLVLAPFGVKDKAIESMGDKIISYRGGIREGDAGEVELRITTKDVDAAKELLKHYEEGNDPEPFVKDFRAAAKAVRDGDDVVITGKLTKGMIELLSSKPNK